MKIIEVLKVSFTSLRTNKLRSILTILGIIVGIFSIIAVSTVISMLQKSIEEGVSSLGKNAFEVRKWPAVRTGGTDWAKYRNRKDLTVSDFLKLQENLNDAKAVAAIANRWGRVIKYRNEKTNPNVNVLGITPEAFITRDLNVSSGRSINSLDFEKGNRVIVLGADVVNVIFKNIDPIGQDVTVDGKKLRVIGVLERKGQIFGNSQDNYALIPLSTFGSFFGERRRSLDISVMAHSKDEYQDLMLKTEGFMRTIRKVPPGEENDFEIISNESVMAQINDITSGVRIGAVVIAAIALLAAGVGIMNIMLVSVTERTREIGVRKSVGAKKKNILVQFIIEAIALCLLGGFIGIFIGILAGNLAGSFLEAQAVIPIDWVIIGITLCVLIGVVFGTYPAYKAANLDPIEALRYE